MYYFTDLETGNLTAGFQRGWFPVRAFLLAYRWPPSHRVLTRFVCIWKESKPRSLLSSYNLHPRWIMAPPLSVTQLCRVPVTLPPSVKCSSLWRQPVSMEPDWIFSGHRNPTGGPSPGYWGRNSTGPGSVVELVVLMIPELTLGLGPQPIHFGGKQTSVHKNLKIEIHYCMFSIAILGLGQPLFQICYREHSEGQNSECQYANVSISVYLYIFHFLPCPSLSWTYTTPSRLISSILTRISGLSVNLKRYCDILHIQ